jgi:hypothetical protein
MKTAVIISGLLLILVANLIMVYYAPYGISPMEAFQNANANTNANANANSANSANSNANNSMNSMKPMAPANNGNAVEGFNSFYLENAGGAKEQYQPVGAFDGVKLSTGNSVSGWRYTAPNEPLTGAEFEPGADSLFMFKNNQCKPECCGASFSCGGGCVCTTPKQRQYIAGRGGNRTEPEDSA